MKNKKGISLIVLIVTIIVIIILAAAVILTLNDNNPIDSSRVAQLADNRASINSAINLYYGKHMAATQGIYDAEHIFTANKNPDTKKDEDKIEGITAIVGEQVGTSNYYKLAADATLKDTIEVVPPTMNGSNGWYIDITTGLVYLVYPNLDSIPSWMFGGAEEKTTETMDDTLEQFVKTLGAEGLVDIPAPANN